MAAGGTGPTGSWWLELLQFCNSCMRYLLAALSCVHGRRAQLSAGECSPQMKTMHSRHVCPHASPVGPYTPRGQRHTAASRHTTVHMRLCNLQGMSRFDHQCIRQVGRQDTGKLGLAGEAALTYTTGACKQGHAVELKLPCSNRVRLYLSGGIGTLTCCKIGRCHVAGPAAKAFGGRPSPAHVQHTIATTFAYGTL